MFASGELSSHGALALIAKRAESRVTRRQGEGIVPDAERTVRPVVRVVRAAGAAAVGLAVPLGWFSLVGSDGSRAEQRTAFIGMLLGVGFTFLVLLATTSLIAGRARARSKARRMRDPWAHGASEWQPAAWTHHWTEDSLIVAAAVSIVTCTVLFFAIGGYTT